MKVIKTQSLLKEQESDYEKESEVWDSIRFCCEEKTTRRKSWGGSSYTRFKPFVGARQEVDNYFVSKRLGDEHKNCSRVFWLICLLSNVLRP